MSHTHWLDREDDGDITIVRCQLHRLTDDEETREVFELLFRLVDMMKRNKIILNLGEVDYLASMAIAKIVMLNRKLERAGGSLTLCQTRERVRNVLRITHLDDLLSICESEADARQALADKPTTAGVQPAN